MSNKAGRLYEFGPFRLDVSERRLLHRQEVVPLSPKLFDTLLVLVEHGGHVLKKDELMRALWPDSFVEESSLMQNISLLRKALGGDAGQYIETVPKHGYRFTAPVRVSEVNGGGATEEATTLPALVARAAVEEETREEEEEEGAHARAGMEGRDAGAASDRRPAVERADAPPAPSTSTAGRARRKLMPACGAALSLLAVIIGGVYFRKAEVREQKAAPGVGAVGRVRSLAVLPFKPLAGEGGDEFLGLGVADALIVKLGNFERLNVRPTSAVIKYAGRASDPRAAGRELDVDAVVDGTIQHAGERVRVTVVLLSTREGEMLWSGTFDERFTDIFALQDSISDRVARVLQLQLSPGKQARLSKRFTENAEAYSYYATGLYFWNKRTKEGLAKAIDYFGRAVETDPDYALARAMLADTYCLTVSYGYDILPSREALDRAEEMGLSALRLDDTLPEAHVAAAAVKDYRKDFSGAEQSYRRAIELDPTSPMARYRYAFDLLAMLDVEDAIREMRSAQELDPVSLPVNTTLAACLIYTGRYDEAVKYSKLALEIDPQFGWARANLGEAYEWKGMYEEAASEYTRLTEQRDFRPYGEIGLASVYARTGRAARARRLLAEIKERHKGEESCRELPLLIALVYAALGEKGAAFLWLEKAVEGRRALLYELRYSRLLNPLKADPRYEQILRRYDYTKSLAAELSKQTTTKGGV
jgi:DNA-binding winged helix-turn-helix (wHTH) protein/TolB-like protein/Flp pilus assembly protein TadD